jgi:hypothetical protein
VNPEFLPQSRKPAGPCDPPWQSGDSDPLGFGGIARKGADFSFAPAGRPPLWIGNPVRLIDGLSGGSKWQGAEAWHPKLPTAPASPSVRVGRPSRAQPRWRTRRSPASQVGWRQRRLDPRINSGHRRGRNRRPFHGRWRKTSPAQLDLHCKNPPRICASRPPEATARQAQDAIRRKNSGRLKLPELGASRIHVAGQAPPPPGPSQPWSLLGMLPIIRVEIDSKVESGGKMRVPILVEGPPSFS